MSQPSTTLHYVANGNFVDGQYAPGADGFNLADVSSLSVLNALPAGVKGLVYLGMVNGADATFQATVSQYIGNPKLYGFYLVDEPDPTGQYGTYASAANLKAESDWIHAHVPGAKTFIVLMNMGSDTNPSYANTYNPANTDIDLFGLDPYPVQSQFSGGIDLNIIPAAVKAAEAAGIPQSQLVPVYQAFGGGTGVYAGYTMPTATQEQEILNTWGSVLPNPAFDYTYSWGSQSGDQSLSTSAALQQVFAAHNGVADPLCFGTGTMIATPAGDVPVQALKPGDPVCLADGGTAPVRWIGRRVIARRFADPPRVLPVRIRAGALGEGVPRRDLLLSPGHAVRVGAVLAHAGALVNGRSIVREMRLPERFVYWHVELDAHALILAEGAAAETFLESHAEAPFDNRAERPAASPNSKELPCPRCRSARQVPRSLREELAARAAVHRPAERAA